MATQVHLRGDAHTGAHDQERPADRAAEHQPGVRHPVRAGGRPPDHDHDTRRTCGSLLAALDVHPRVAMAILRHSRIGAHDGDLHPGARRFDQGALRRLSDLLGDHRADGPAARAYETDGAGAARAEPQ